MAFSRPTLEEIIARIRADIETKLSGADADLRYVFESILAVALAGGHHLEHGHIVWLSKQVFPDTAESEYMRQWAGIYGVPPQDPAYATGSLPITGTPGTLCPAGTEWQTNDEVVFVQDADVTLNGGGTGTVALTAEVVGADGNILTGTTLSLVSPVAGIDSSGVTITDFDNGADAETDPQILARILLRLQTPPKGGGDGDYEAWALEVSGVTRAWEYANQYGVGTVGLTFVRDNDGSGAAIIPSAGEVATVQAYLETVAPITQNETAETLTVWAPTANTMNVTITSLTPDTAAIRLAIEAELTALLADAASPGGTVYLSQINEAISRATGETDHVMTVPATNFTSTSTQIPVLGTITWPP